MWALTLLLYTTQSNRWDCHIVVVFTIALWLFCCCLYITMLIPSCCVRIIVLFNCCTSYDAHISNVRQVFSVCYSVFFTIPCIFWHHPRCRELCCILHNNISILSRLTTSLMWWLLQHYLHPFSCTYHSVKTQLTHKLVLKIDQKSSLLYVVFITSLGCSSLHNTRHKKYTAFRGVCVLSLRILTFGCKRDESGSHGLSGHYFLRSRYSPLAVSTEITSPVFIKAGTLTTRPVSSVASLSTLLVVSPFTTSSV